MPRPASPGNAGEPVARSSRTTLVRRNEWTVLLGLLVVVVLAAVLPGLEQPAQYHAFADTRSIGGVRNGANVLSNAGFVLAALAIALGLARDTPLSRVSRASLAVVALGLLLTAAGSAYYHASPDNHTLFWDRLPLTLAMAGIVAAALSQRISARAGSLALVALAVLGPLTVLYWRATDNLMPYVVLQGGEMLALLLVVAVTARRTDPLAWWWLIAWYAAAKAAEFLDAPILSLTQGLVSGHTMKHLLAALAAFGLAYPLWRARPAMPASG